MCLVLVGEAAGREVGTRGGHALPRFRRVESLPACRIGGPEEPTGDAVQLTNRLLLLTQPLVNSGASLRQVMSPPSCNVLLYEMKGSDQIRGSQPQLHIRATQGA